MKVLVVHPGPAFSVADVHTGLVKGLRANGVQVFEYSLDDRLTAYSLAHIKKGRRWVRMFSDNAVYDMAAVGVLADCYMKWPDVVILVSTMFIPPWILGVLEARPHLTVAWFTESPYEDRQQMQVAAHVDMAIVNDDLNLETFWTVNPRTYHLPHSYDPDLHRPGPVDPDLACDFAFVGTGFPSRVEFFEECDFSGIDVKLAGNWQIQDSPINKHLVDGLDVCCPNEDAVRLYQSCKVSANLYRQEINEGGRNDGNRVGPREVELAACGTFFLRNPRMEGDTLFPMLPTFTEPDEFTGLLRWALDHPAECETAAASARAAIADRTFTNTAAKLLRLIDKGKK